jgi:hypothetical protein
MPFIPESLKKKMKTAEAIKVKSDAAAKAAAEKAVADKAAMIQKAESYVAEYKALEDEAVNLRRAAKASGSYYVPAEPKLAFVVRIRGRLLSQSHFFFLTFPFIMSKIRKTSQLSAHLE